MANIIPIEITQYLKVHRLIQSISENEQKLSLSTLAFALSNIDSHKNSILSHTTSDHYPGSFIEIPEVLESKETYEFIGLTEKVASEVWERYSTSDPDMPDTFL